MESIVRWFNNDRGYGYIEIKGNDILIHYCAFREQEEIVEFTLTENKEKG